MLLKNNFDNLLDILINCYLCPFANLPGIRLLRARLFITGLTVKRPILHGTLKRYFVKKKSNENKRQTQ